MLLNATLCGIVVSKYHPHVTHDILTTAQKYYTEDPPHSHPSGRAPSLASPHIRESKTVLDVRFHALDSGLQAPDSSLCQWNPGFLELYFWLQKPGFPIPQAKFSRIPDSTSKHFQDSGILISFHGATCRPFNERRLLSGAASTAIRYWIFWEQRHRL